MHDIIYTLSGQPFPSGIKEKEVVITGASRCVELWNPERWAPIENSGLDPENLAAAMEELGF